MDALQSIIILAQLDPLITFGALLMVAVIGLIWLGLPLLQQMLAPPAKPPCSMQSQPQRPACGAFLISEPKEEENNLKSLENIIAMAHEKPAITTTTLLLVSLNGLAWNGRPLLSQP